MSKNRYQGDSDSYLAKKSQLASLITVYGRNPVFEALNDRSMSIAKLHLADSNRPSKAVQEMIDIAERRGIEVLYHERKALSRISKNGKQDQGVALDIQCPLYRSANELLKKELPARILAVDGITNPQNLGMIIRSACAGNIDALLLSTGKGNVTLSPLVIKASAGTLFKMPIYHCHNLAEGLTELKQHGADICTLSSYAKTTLFDYRPAKSAVYVLGNETEGVSKSVEAVATVGLNIPMNRGVESLNVAVTGALIAFLP
ncbi:23S rRNA (guanosine2251-2'-O)-methyltransferase [Sinobacterium caligoides]|uniref:23S rRNA (Guanosine2251-2'-O)-methyltransferase n=1 Tax=Sinobacterium caligoides TaxID=933926 RepID=A0A3N2DKJ4_9GAMM|nr:RNA methyltransferase [Sinobacterium caligoides]ROS00324.1 23S rRNA (guanosine2251-2'-O)-methyltransferase [Sinobacterium caligoides]